MHRAAVDAHAGFERAVVRVEAGKRGQQRWMDIDEPAAVARNEAVRQYPHEARQHDEIRPVAVDFRG